MSMCSGTCRVEVQCAVCGVRRAWWSVRFQGTRLQFRALWTIRNTQKPGWGATTTHFLRKQQKFVSSSDRSCFSAATASVQLALIIDRPWNATLPRTLYCVLCAVTTARLPEYHAAQWRRGRCSSRCRSVRSSRSGSRRSARDGSPVTTLDKLRFNELRVMG